MEVKGLGRFERGDYCHAVYSCFVGHQCVCSRRQFSYNKEGEHGGQRQKTTEVLIDSFEPNVFLMDIISRTHSRKGSKNYVRSVETGIQGQRTSTQQCLHRGFMHTHILSPKASPRASRAPDVALSFLGPTLTENLTLPVARAKCLLPSLSPHLHGSLV